MPNPTTVSTRADLAAIASPDPNLSVLLAEAGRAGTFVWRAGNFSGRVSVDPQQIVYVASSTISANTGCWVREYSGPLSARWAGCVSDTTMANELTTSTDNAPALNALFSLAAALKASVHIPASSPGRYSASGPAQGAGYGVKSVLTIPSGLEVSGDGPGSVDSFDGSQTGTCIVATAEMTQIIKVSGNSKLSRFSANGRNRAKVGIMWDNSARPTGRDLDVARCTVSSYVLNRTQNGSFFNICSRLSKNCIMLANQARNNRFFQATGAVAQYNGPDPEEASLIMLVSDYEDKLDIGLITSAPAPSGNDLNQFFGGIFEFSPTGIKVVGDELFQDKFAYAGTTSFFGTEITANIIIDTTAVTIFEGTLSFTHGAWIGSGEGAPLTVGTLGYIQFTGIPSFNGGASLANRGITLSSNYLDLFRSVQSDIRRLPSSATPGIGSGLFPASWDAASTVVFDDMTSALTITVPSTLSQPFNGIVLAMSGPAAHQNYTQPGVTFRTRRVVVEMIFTVEGVPDGQEIAVYISITTSPSRRLIGNFGNGTHQVLRRIAEDEGAQFTFGRGSINDGTGGATWTMANISILVKG